MEWPKELWNIRANNRIYRVCLAETSEHWATYYQSYDNATFFVNCVNDLKGSFFNTKEEAIQKFKDDIDLEISRLEKLRVQGPKVFE